MSETTIYQMFDIIAQSAVGNVGNVSLILLQLYISVYVEIKLLFASMKNRSGLVQFSVTMLPLVLIATYCLAAGIIFSAFLEKGPDLDRMTELVNLTLSRQCIREMLLTVAIFFVLMLVYSIAYRLKPLQLLMTFGMELLAALALLALYGGLLVQDFPFTILDLCDRDLLLARWPIYGYFTLLFKCCVLAVSLVLGALLRERKEKPVTDEEFYQDRSRLYERKTLRFLTKDTGLIGAGYLTFSIAAQLFFVWGMVNEGSWALTNAVTILLVTALFMSPAVIGAYCLYRALRPQTSVPYRQLLAMGDRDTVLRLFCNEVVDGPRLKHNLWKNMDTLQTAHFLFSRQGIKIRVQWCGAPLPTAATMTVRSER